MARIIGLVVGLVALACSSGPTLEGEVSTEAEQERAVKVLSIERDARGIATAVLNVKNTSDYSNDYRVSCTINGGQSIRTNFEPELHAGDSMEVHVDLGREVGNEDTVACKAEPIF